VYADSTGKEFGFRVFQSQVVNNTVAPIELTINFPKVSFELIPADSIASFGIPKSDRYVKVFLFPPSMIPAKQKEAYNYGITGIDSFLNTGLSKPTALKTIIQPKQEYVLYIGALIYPESQRARSTLFIKGQNLIYKIMIDPPLDSALIPCGQIVFKK
jgi:hypothetical protein